MVILEDKKMIYSKYKYPKNDEENSIGGNDNESNSGDSLIAGSFPQFNRLIYCFLNRKIIFLLHSFLLKYYLYYI